MITTDKRKTVFLLHQEGMPIREISRRLKLSRNAVRRIIAQAGQMPGLARPPAHVIDPDLLRQLYQECHGYAQRMAEKLREEHGIAIKYSTLTRYLRELGLRTSANDRCERVPTNRSRDATRYQSFHLASRIGVAASAGQPALLALPSAGISSFIPSLIASHEVLPASGPDSLGLCAWDCVIDNTNLARCAAGPRR
jgi:transposase